MTFANNPALRLFLDRISARSRLTREEQDAILNLEGHAAQARANADFVRLGEKVEHACLIVEGLAGRFGQNSDGQRQITALHIPGDMVDLHSVVVPDSGSALQALTTTTLIRIPHSALLAIARRFPGIAEAFWRDSVLDAAILSQWVVNVGRRNAIARTAHLICEMALRYEQIGRSSGMSFEFPATQTHLGDALGLTPVHVNRTLKTLKEAGVAEVRNRSVQIHDWESLATIGDFDPTYLKVRSAVPEKLAANC